MNSSGNFNKPSTTISQKKEKNAAKNSAASHMMTSSSISASATTSRTNNSDVLKLPTNTYLRPVSSNNLSNQTLRCNTTYSIPVQRFNNPVSL